MTIKNQLLNKTQEKIFENKKVQKYTLKKTNTKHSSLTSQHPPIKSSFRILHHIAVVIHSAQFPTETLLLRQASNLIMIEKWPLVS